MKLICRVCKQKLDAEKHFYPRAGSRTGYQYECKKCRSEINSASRARRREREKAAKQAEEKESKAKAKWNHKEAHRKKLLTAAATKIAAGELIAETPRSMTFNLALIVEQQLRMFYGREIKSALNQPRMTQILDDTLFELKQALGRAGVRMKPVIAAEKTPLNLEEPLNGLKKKAEARALLGVSTDATQDEIKKAYRSKAMTAHPDHQGQTEEMQKLNEAYAVLVEEANGR